MGSDTSRDLPCESSWERLDFTTAGPDMLGGGLEGRPGRPPPLYYSAVGPGFQPEPVTLPRRSTLTIASRMTAPPSDSSKDGMLKSRWLIVAMPK